MSTHIAETFHAINRKARRNLSDEDIQFVYEHGHHVRCAGVLHVFLARRDIPREKCISTRFAHLEGTTLVLDDTNGRLVLLTAYRNRNGFKDIRTKTKYERRPKNNQNDTAYTYA
jgi:hypothetical protein